MAPYDIAAFPSYWLIAPDGRILSDNFLRPSQLISHFGEESGYLSRYIRLQEQVLEEAMAGQR